jgi:hypothetical protein
MLPRKTLGFTPGHHLREEKNDCPTRRCTGSPINPAPGDLCVGPGEMITTKKLPHSLTRDGKATSRCEHVVPCMVTPREDVFIGVKTGKKYQSGYLCYLGKDLTPLIPGTPYSLSTPMGGRGHDQALLFDFREFQ